MSHPTILVLDGDQRAALAVVRSLGARGCRIQVGSPTPHSIAGGSRFAAGETVLPDPLRDPLAFSRAVDEFARRCQADLVLPITEPSTLSLLEQQQELSHARLPAPDLARFRRASDKEAVLALAGSLGIDTPAQWTLSGEAGEIGQIPTDRYPLVVKPARSVAGVAGNRRKVGVRYAESPSTLAQVLTELGRDAGPFLVQARIEGPGMGVFLLRWEGKVVARFAHRRIREKPPSGGVSVCCESVPLPEALFARSSALLDALDWQGVAMIEYKQELRSGRSYLMEINPRFWGSLQLAVDAGVDFPWLLVQLASGEQVAPVEDWSIGRRSRWCWGEVDHLIARLRQRPSALNLPADDPGLLRTALGVLVPWRPGQRSDVFRWTDPLPFVRESVAWVKAL